MKLLLYILITFILLTGCSDFNSDGSSTKYPIAGGYRIRTIEGCEYFEYRKLCHKGNCPNPIHKQHDTIYINSTIHDTIYFLKDSHNHITKLNIR